MMPTSGSRACHWVLKIGNLKTALSFYEAVFGLKVLRHEEFSSGCEATCNGPYNGAWSKTMVGYGPERTNFALELTYNYGIDSYESGNDLQYIAFQGDVSDIKAKSEATGYPVTQHGASILIKGPDGYKYRVIPTLDAHREEKFLCVGVRVSSLSKATAYWTRLLGLGKFPVPPALTPSALGEGDYPSLLVGFEDTQVKLHLLQCPAEGAEGAEARAAAGEGEGEEEGAPVEEEGAAVEHKDSGGRIAFACKKVQPIYDKVQANGQKVLNPPLTLPTPGKADVVVTILADPDGYEICFVEDEAFYDLATPTYDVVDFAERASRGGDGAPPPKSAKLHHAGGETVAVETAEELEPVLEAARGSGQVVVLDFGAGWCKNCQKLSPEVDRLAGEHRGQLRVVTVDIDEATELAEDYEVTKLPYFVFLSSAGEKVDEYLGSDKAELSAKVDALVTAVKA